MKYIITDIDGVLTDGRFTIDANGNETKQLCYRDLDAIGIGRRAGYEFVFLTGESGDMPKRIAKRFNVSYLYEGAKDKLPVFKEIAERFNIAKEDLVYIGDSNRDVPALEYAARSYAPEDAVQAAKDAVTCVVPVKGGYGVLLYVVEEEMRL